MINTSPVRYGAILADPPWRYFVRSDKGKGRSAENYYNTMTAEEIKNLPISKIAAEDSVLFLWVTWPTLLQGIETGQAWGFEYKTCAFLWAKTTKSAVSKPIIPLESNRNWRMNLGYYTRANTDPVLLFTKGHPKRKSKGVRQLVVAPQGAHSAKPIEIHYRVEQLVEGPYLELFAREQQPNWTCLGNEINGLDISHALLAI